MEVGASPPTTSLQQHCSATTEEDVTYEDASGIGSPAMRPQQRDDRCEDAPQPPEGTPAQAPAVPSATAATAPPLSSSSMLPQPPPQQEQQQGQQQQRHLDVPGLRQVRGNESESTATTTTTGRVSHIAARHSVAGGIGGGNSASRDRPVRKRKKRPSALAAAGGGGGAAGTSALLAGFYDDPSHHHHYSYGGHVHPQQPMRRSRQSWGRRFARVRWALLMWLPMVLLFLHRSERLAVDTDGVVTTTSILVSSAALLLFILVNELSDGVQWLHYALALFGGAVWGAMIGTLEDLIAARLICVTIFGIASGQLRYHWDIVAHRRARHGGGGGSGGSGGSRSAGSPAAAAVAAGVSALFLRGGARAGPAGGNGSSGGSGGGAGTQQQHQHGRSSRHNARGGASSATVGGGGGAGRRASAISTFLSRTLVFLARTVGLGPWLAIGELVGCAAHVPNSWKTISISWWGYALVVLFPLLTYKFSSAVSHFMILLCGSRVHSADASRILYLKWAATTVLSLVIHAVTIGLFLYNLLPYVWSLQLLVAPYCVVLELVSWESRHQQLDNPYKEVAEAYAEHIHFIKAQKAEYF